MGLQNLTGNGGPSVLERSWNKQFPLRAHSLGCSKRMAKGAGSGLVGCRRPER